MSIEDKTGISLISGFKLLAERPLDVREVVDTLEERDALVTSHVAYPGLRVFVKADKNTYSYNGESWDLFTTGTAYVHPTDDGNLHVPATGTTHNGYMLVAGDTAGSFYWKKVVPSDIDAANAIHTHTKADITDLVIPTKLPNPFALSITTLGENDTLNTDDYDGSTGVSLNLTPSGLGMAPASHTHTKSEITDFPESIKNPSALTLSLNGESQGDYDGSSAKSINISPLTIGAATKVHTHTKDEITDFPDTSKTQNPLKVYLGSGSAEPKVFNGEKEISVIVSPSTIDAAEKNHTHVADDISGLPSVLPNPQPLSISLNGSAQTGYTGSEKVSIDITPSSIGAAASSHTHPYAGAKIAGGAANSVANAFKMSLNGGGAEGVNYFTFDGSAEKSVNITPASIGASASDHTHNYAGSSTAGGAATEASKTTGSLEVSFNNISQGSFNGSGDMDINITPDAIGASATSHTHNYAGSSSVGGAANSALKLDSERVISLSGEVTGSVSFDGTQDVTIDTSVSGIDASKVISGVFDIDRIPKAAVERCAIVADDAARFRLTIDDVQKGDTVKVVDTNLMYFVVDDSKLDSEDGYESYSAGQASSVPWSGVTGKPDTFAPSAHTHTKSEITDFPVAMKNPNTLSVKVGSNAAIEYDGSSARTINITPASIGASASDHTHNYAGSSVPGGDATNALSANQVANSLSISLNGANSKTFNGSKAINIDITPSGIGASAIDHTHPYAGSSTAGGAANKVANTLSIKLNSGSEEGTDLFTFDGSVSKTINITTDSIGAAASVHGHHADDISGLPTALKTPNALTIQLAGTNQGSWDGSAAKTINITAKSIKAAEENHTHNYAGSSTVGGAADRVASNLAIKLNGGTTEGTNLFTFNGSAAKTVNITPAAIGASATGHTHNYAGSSSAGGAAILSEKVANTLTVNMGSNAILFDGSAAKTVNITPAAIGASASDHTHNYAGSSTAGGAATSATKVPVPVGTVLFSISSTSTFFSTCFGGTWEVVGNLDATVGGEGGTVITLYMFKKTAN